MDMKKKKTITRQEAIQRIIAHDLRTLEPGQLSCNVLSREGWGCQGLYRYSDLELQKIYAEDLQSMEEVYMPGETFDREKAEQVITDKEIRNLKEKGYQISCEMMAAEGRACMGLHRYTNLEIKWVYSRLFEDIDEIIDGHP